MKDFIKIPVFILLIVPSIILTFIIWIFGGWTKKWDYMPNPADSLINWMMWS